MVLGAQGNNQQIVLDLNGNVGIGTTSPTEKLEVNGTVRSKKVKVEANGQDLGLIQQMLLEKIEELTLYVIKLKKQNDRQQREIETLKKIQNEK